MSQLLSFDGWGNLDGLHCANLAVFSDLSTPPHLNPYLSFSINLQKDDQENVIYDPESLLENPISISVPDLITSFEEFIQSFKMMGLVEQNPDNATNYLRGLSGEVYICQAKDLDQTALEKLCEDLVRYLKKFNLSLSSEKLLDNDISPQFSGLQEIIALRNYLTQYVKSAKKIYRDGYVYVMPMG
ncbi:hypothetical protein [Spirulina major]|uniref:hypothetical protein n=1 Tax=Spirulina major TaxID=270636 RepID=UPI001586FBC0|nr:hypothetical protein [Spirulina major]